MQIITHIDQLLPHIGEFGLFQFLYLSILCLVTIPCSFQTLIVYFVNFDPPWRCKVNSTVCKINGALDKTSNDFNFRCKIARDEWEYTEEKYYSIVTQFDLNCDREHLIFITTSMFFIGMIVGCLGIGFLGDKYGRAKIMKPATVIAMVLAFLSSFVPSYWVFAFSRFLLGLLAPGTVVMFFVVASEMVGPKRRPAAGIILWMFFTLGLIILGLVAMATSTWKYLMIYSTAPYIIIFPLLFFLPESLRWLYVNNRQAECIKLYKQIARINGKTLPEIQLAPPKVTTREINPMLLFSSSRMFLKSLNIGFAWLVNGLVYYGTTLAAKDLTGNFHRDFILSSLVEFPAAVIAVIASMKLGRKKTTQVPLFLGGIFIALVAAIDEKDPNKHLVNTRLFFGLAGKFFLTLAYDAIYTWTVELYPTQIRTEAMGFVQITSRIGAAASPWIAEWLRIFNWRIPFIVMGVLAVVASLFLHFLHETKDLQTPEYLESDELTQRLESQANGKKTHDKLSLVREEEEEELDDAT